MVKAGFKMGGAALLLSVSVLSGLSLPAAGTIKVYADTGSEPSVSAYADKATLAGDTFKPQYDANGTFEGKTAKIYFGKNEDGDKQEWYVLGSDGSIKNDNTAIFAASNMIYYHDSDKPSVKFASNYDDRTYDEETVFSNHYGASDIRTVLRAMAGEEGTVSTNINTSRFMDNNGTKLFTETEKNLLQATEVSTDNFRDPSSSGSSREYIYNPTHYTTSDKLYLGAWDYGDKQSQTPSYKTTDTFYIGSEKSKKVLAVDPYWSSSQSGYKDSWFWLRSPFSDYYDFSLIAIPGVGANCSIVDFSDNGVRPASNLNLTSFLFASSVPAEWSESKIEEAASITAGAAMTLRRDGSEKGGNDKNIGSVKVEADKITITKGSTSETVTLVVQGAYKDDDEEVKNWYLRKKITSSTEVNTDEIKNSIKNDLGASTSVDLTKCKIWLEITDSDGMAYAVDTTTTPAHEHKYDDSWTAVDGEQHGHACIAEGCPDPLANATAKEAHTYGETNVCTKCGYRLGDHIVTKVKREPATRTSVGYEEHFECSHCDKWFEIPATELGALIEHPKSYFEIPKISGGGSSSGSSSSSSSTSGSWTKDSSGWRIRNSDGTYVKGSVIIDANGNKIEKVLWQNISGKCFAIGSDGYLRTGWICDGENGSWYYCDENTGRSGGWFLSPQDGYWYYLSPSTGEMLTGWQSINGKSYYFATAPSVPTYSFDSASNTWVYSNPSGIRPFGSMYANAVTPDNYQVDASGAWIR